MCSQMRQNTKGHSTELRWHGSLLIYVTAAWIATLSMTPDYVPYLKLSVSSKVSAILRPASWRWETWTEGLTVYAQGASRRGTGTQPGQVRNATLPELCESPCSYVLLLCVHKQSQIWEVGKFHKLSHHFPVQTRKLRLLRSILRLMQCVEGKTL